MVRQLLRCRCAPSMIAAAMLLLSPVAHAAISCSGVTVTSVSGTTPAAGNLDMTGNITVTCTRLTTDATSQAVYIGINAGENPDGTAGREMTRQTGTQQMDYAIFRNATPSGGWSEGAGRAPGSATGGGLQVTVNFSSAATTAQSFSFPYYVRVTNANYSGTARPPGIYDDQAVRVRVRLDSRTGPIQGDAFFNVTVSKPSHCFFSTPPSALSISYTSFSTTAQTGSTNFNVSCTATTAYTLSLDATSGVLLGLTYSLALSGSSGVGTGFPQNYSVNGTIPAGQAGTCTTPTCTGTQPRVVTISY
jgi:spore coat protein U-like protein